MVKFLFSSYFKKYLPKQIEVSGFPSAQSNPNGIYIALDEKHNGRPAYKQKDNSYHLYYDGRKWIINSSKIDDTRCLAYFGEGIEHPCLYTDTGAKYADNGFKDTNDVKIKPVDSLVNIIFIEIYLDLHVESCALFAMDGGIFN